MYGTEIPGQTLFLHCGRIEFLHPVTKEKIILEAKPNFPLFKEYLGTY